MLYVCSALRPLLCIKLCTLSCLYKHTQDTVLSGHLLDLLPRTLVKGDFAARPRELTESNVMKEKDIKAGLQVRDLCGHIVPRSQSGVRELYVVPVCVG